jgi:hypothetical protein
MSIWEDCEKHGAVPFYGFPVKPKLENGLIIWEFPIGYEPNGSQTKEVAEKLHKIVGGELIEVTDKVIKIKPEETKLGYLIYKAFLDER